MRPWGVVLMLVSGVLAGVAGRGFADEGDEGKPPGSPPLAEVVAREVERLAAPEYGVREAARAELEKLGEAALPYLRPYLENPDPEVARVVRMLLDARDRLDLARLLAALEDAKGSFTGSEEMDALVSRGREILPELYRVLDEEDARYPSYSFWRMRNAYAVIGSIAGQEDLDRLLRRLAHPNPQHRYLLRPILDRLDREEVADRIFDLLAAGDEDARLRAQLIETLPVLPWLAEDPRAPAQVRKSLLDPAPPVRAAACRWYTGRRDEDAAELLICRTRDEHPDVRAAAITGLRGTLQVQPPSGAAGAARAAVLTGLEDPSGPVRAAALEVLFASATPDLAPRIRPLLADPDLAVRTNAARLLGRISDADSLPGLLALLESRDPEFLARGLHAVLGAVSDLRDPVAVEALFRLLEDGDEVELIGTYRYLILSAIVSCGGDAVVPRIRPWLANPEVQNRQIVLNTLLNRQPPLSDEALVPILVDTVKTPGDPRLRASAVQGLVRRDHDAAAPILLKALREEEDAWFRSETVKALVTFGYEPAKEEIRKLLDLDPRDRRNFSVLTACIRATARFRMEEAAPDVLALIVADEVFRSAGVQALGRIGNASVVPRLREIHAATSSPGARYLLELALARLGEPEPLEQRLLEESAGGSDPLPAARAARRIEMLVALGRTKEALSRIDAVLPEARDDARLLRDLAGLLAEMGEKDRAFQALERSIEKQPRTRLDLRNDPDLDPLKTDDRFADLLRKAR